MAFENKSVPAPKGPSLGDTQARDGFISVALRELISRQVSDWKINHEMAAVLAVRYANAVMVARATETTPLKTVISKGTPSQEPPVANDNTADDNTNPPKSIAEIIGDAPKLEEVK